MDEKQPRYNPDGQNNPYNSGAPPLPPTSKEQKRQSTTRYLKLNRLPTLQEVLERRTRPPLDLFCFYIFLQRESAEDALDFWLDVHQHENMCKAYFKDLRKSRRSVQEEWPEFASYARTNGTHFAPLLNLPEETEDPNNNGNTRSPEQFHEPQLNSPRDLPSPGAEGTNTRMRRDTESHGPRSPVMPHDPLVQFGSGVGAGSSTMQRDRPSDGPPIDRTTMGSRLSMRGRWAERKSKAPTIIARDRAIEKAALTESAERIYLRYLLPGAEREIYLPPSLRLQNFPITNNNGEGGDGASPLIPDLFHAQKVYIFKALEQDAFPRFLRAKAFSNLTPMGSFVRLIAGLICLWGGFVLAFSLIFLDYQPKLTRLWMILPFIFAFNFLLAAYYSLSPLLALLSYSETTPFNFIRVREGYVKRLVGLRALWIEVVCIVLTAILTVIFTVVPGHRL